ncbi:MFS transporter [Pontibacterium granulatum]|uniref:MFS transporter n=1 Tax=Pontibacterium granulatum TaxID=2036029 RepID=UPI00249C6611|nr:MFS transporter [Pontibacterium granulatum]MDI3324542.1 MFS transporter [Pontibacterium granulatum]
MQANTVHRRSLWFLWGGQCIAIAAMEMSGPFWPLFLRDQVGLQGELLLLWSAALIAAPMITAFATAAFWGRIGDRYGHKWMVLRALLGLALTQWLIAQQDLILMILCLRLLQGALAGVIAAAMAYGLHLCTENTRSRTLGYLQSATAAGTLLGPVVGGLVSDLWDYSQIFQFAAAACIAVALVMLVALTDDRKQINSITHPNEAAAPHWQHGKVIVQGLLLALVICQVARMMPQSFFALYVEDSLAVSNMLIGVLYGASGLAMLVAAPLWGRRLDGQRNDTVLLQASALALFSALLMLLHSLEQNLWSLLVLRFAWGICLAATMPTLFGLLSRLRATSGRSVGPGQAAVKLGNFSGYLLGGLVAALYNSTLAFGAVALTYLLLALWLWWLRKLILSQYPNEKETGHATPV